MLADVRFKTESSNQNSQNSYIIIKNLKYSANTEEAQQFQFKINNKSQAKK